MKMDKRIWIVIALAAAVGLVLAKRQREKSEIPPQAAAPAELSKPLPRLVDLGAGKCIPCKAMAPILEELRAEYVDVFHVEFIDVWENPDAARPYGINLIPTQIFFDANGVERWRHEGFLGKAEILAKWRELGVVN